VTAESLSIVAFIASAVYRPSLVEFAFREA